MKRWLKHEISNEFTLALARLNWRMRKFFAILGIIAMLGSLLPQNNKVIAYTLPADEESGESSAVQYPATTDESFDYSSLELLGEVESLRTETTKTFQRVDGSFLLALYDEAIHYNKDGKWTDIDNSLIYDESSDTYENTENNLKIKFPKNIEENKKIKLSIEDYSISWAIQGIAKSQIQYSNPYYESTNIKELFGINQEILYEDIMPGVDIQYIISGNKIKENILINRYIDNFIVSFEYSTKNLTMISNDGVYQFVDDDGTVVFTFDEMYAIDAEGETTNCIDFHMVETRTGEYSVTLSVDNEWMKNASYPVNIDPTISSYVQSVSIYDTYVSEIDPSNSSFYSRTYMQVSSLTEGDDYNGLIRFYVPTYILGKQITSAYMTLSKGSDSSQGRTLVLYENVGANFSATSASWSNRPSHIEDKIVDYHIVGDSNKYVFDITDVTRKWISSGVYAVPGFTIEDKEAGGGINKILSKENTDASSKPLFEIGYIDPAGIKDYWTYTSQDIGTAGTGYVSNYYGNLTIVRNDINFSTDLQSLSLGFAYNELNRAVSFGYGKGWNISYNTKLVYDTAVGLFYVVDYTGNKVYYHLIANDSRYQSAYPVAYTTYQAEDGSGNLLIQVVAYGYLGARFLLTPDGLKLNFSTTNGYLSSITDTKSSTSIVITRDSTKLDLVDRITDSVGNYIQLLYDSTDTWIQSATLFLKQADASYNAVETTEYQFTKAGYPYALSGVIHKKNYEIELDMEVTDTLEYDYDTTQRLIYAVQTGGNSVDYSYTTSTSHKIENISTKYNTNLISQVTLEYNYQTTRLTDQNGDYIIYIFDDYGHTVTVTDSEGFVISYRYMNPYRITLDSEGKIVVNEDDVPGAIPVYAVNNHLISQSEPQSAIYNPVNNGGFEVALTSEVDWTAVKDDGPGDYSVALSNTTMLSGQYSLRMHADEDTYGHTEENIVIAKSGVYTLSAYVKNDDSAGGIYIEVEGASYGQPRQYVTSDCEWTRVLLTFGVYSDDSIVKIILGASETDSTYFDNIQVLDGFTDGRVNILDNSSFEFGVSNPTVVPEWYTSGNNAFRSSLDSINNDIYADIFGNWAVRIDGNGSQLSNAYVQDIDSKYTSDELNQLTQLVFGGWVYSEGAPTSNSSYNVEDGYNRFIRMKVDFLSSEQDFGTTGYDAALMQTAYIYFDGSITGWQYGYAVVDLVAVRNYRGEDYPSLDIDQINLFLEYTGEGSVLFDGLQLYYTQDTTNYEYNQYGLLTKVKSGAEDALEYEYYPEKDYASTPKYVRNTSSGTTSTVVVDSAERISGVVINNVSSTASYNSYGQVLDLTTGNETTHFTTSTSYSHFSQYTSTFTNEYGFSTQYHVNTLTGILEAISNSKGEDSYFIYTNDGQLQEVRSTSDYLNDEVEDAHARVIYQYDEQNRLTDIILAEEIFSYHIEYDDLGRMEEIWVNTQPVAIYTYEMDGTYYTDRISTQTYANGDAIRFDYNDDNQVEYIQFKDSVTGEFENKFSYLYDQNGRLQTYNTIENDEIVASETYTYSSTGKLMQIIDLEGNRIEYNYDGSGNLLSLFFAIDETSSTTNYHYNECFEYDENSICTSVSSLYDYTSYTSFAGQNVIRDYHYEMSALYRLQYLELTVGTVNSKQNFIYDDYNTRILHITYEINGSGVDYQYSYTYDELGNIEHEIYLEGSTTSIEKNYEYDELNRLIVEDSRDWSVGSTILTEKNFTKYYYYDSLGNMTDVKTFLFGQNDTTFPTPVPFYLCNTGNYDAIVIYNGNKTYQNIYYLNVGQTPSLSFVYYDVWDSGHDFPIEGMVTTLVSGNLNTSVAGYYYRTYHATNNSNYSLDFKIIFQVGVPTSYPTIPQEHTHYVYDDSWLDQLEGTQEWTYDANGAHTGTTTIHSFMYDQQGNPTNISNLSYEGEIYNGELKWDGRQLAYIYLCDTITGVPDYKISYKYNDQGIRTSKTIHNYINSTNQIIEYTLSGMNVIYETDGVYAIIYYYDYNSTLIGFSYDPDINVENNEVDFFYLFNQMGDITHIVNASGDTVVQYYYDAFGIIEDIQFAQGYDYVSQINPYTYRGYRFDTEINMYYLNSRFYFPETGRFINADVVLGELGSIGTNNMYSYCENNPIMYSDITGLAPEWLKTAGVWGAVIGTILVVAAITILSCGVGTTVLVTLGGAILHGAAVGALIGAAAGIGLGATAGAVGSLFAGEQFGSEEFWSNTLYGGLAGFGAGAVIGAAIGGAGAGLRYTTSGLSKGAINQAVKSTLSNSSKMRHIMQLKHGLPANINAVGSLMRNTLINGTISSYGSAYTAIWAAGGAQVTFIIIDGLIRISDMWAI